MSKQLSMTKIKEENKIYDEFIEIDVEVNNEEFIVKLFPYFAPDKVTDLINSMTEFYKKADEEKLKVTDDEFDDLLGYFIVRKFTDIKMTQSKKAKTVYDEYTIAKRSKLFKVILNAIPEESIEYIQEQLFEFQEMNRKYMIKYEQLRDKMENLPLENNEIVDRVFNKSENVVQ